MLSSKRRVLFGVLQRDELALHPKFETPSNWNALIVGGRLMWIQRMEMRMANKMEFKSWKMTGIVGEAETKVYLG